MDRKLLRKKIVEILKDANIPKIGQDVFSQRSVPSDIEGLPVLLVYSKNTSVQRFDESPKRYMESVDITIECVTQHSDDELLADEMDDLALAVEKVIEDNFELENICQSVELKSVVQDTEGDGQSPVGSAKVTYTFEILNEPRTDIVLPGLKTMENNFKMNDNLNNDAKDVLDLPQE
jgi:hypothetical protein